MRIALQYLPQAREGEKSMPRKEKGCKRFTICLRSTQTDSHNSMYWKVYDDLTTMGVPPDLIQYLRRQKDIDHVCTFLLAQQGVGSHVVDNVRRCLSHKHFTGNLGNTRSVQNPKTHVYINCISNAEFATRLAVLLKIHLGKIRSDRYDDFFTPESLAWDIDCCGGSMIIKGKLGLKRKNNRRVELKMVCDTCGRAVYVPQDSLSFQDAVSVFKTHMHPFKVLKKLYVIWMLQSFGIFEQSILMQITNNSFLPNDCFV